MFVGGGVTDHRSHITLAPVSDPPSDCGASTVLSSAPPPPSSPLPPESWSGSGVGGARLGGVDEYVWHAGDDNKDEEASEVGA